MESNHSKQSNKQLDYYYDIFANVMFQIEKYFPFLSYATSPEINKLIDTREVEYFFCN